MNENVLLVPASVVFAIGMFLSLLYYKGKGKIRCILTGVASIFSALLIVYYLQAKVSLKHLDVFLRGEQLPESTYWIALFESENLPLTISSFVFLVLGGFCIVLAVRSGPSASEADSCSRANRELEKWQENHEDASVQVKKLGEGKFSN